MNKDYEEFRNSGYGLTGLETAGAIAGGAATGIATGAALGPAGMIVGGIGGALVGAGQAGLQQKSAYDEYKRQQELDKDLARASRDSEAYLQASALQASMAKQQNAQQVASLSASQGLSPGASLALLNKANQGADLAALATRGQDFATAKQATLAGRDQVLQEYANAQSLAGTAPDNTAANLAGLSQAVSAVGTVQSGGTAGAQGQGTALANIPTKGGVPANALPVQAPPVSNLPPDYASWRQQARLQDEMAALEPRTRAAEASGVGTTAQGAASPQSAAAVTPSYTKGADGIIQVEGVQPLDLSSIDRASTSDSKAAISLSQDTESGFMLADGGDPFEGIDLMNMGTADREKLYTMGISPSTVDAASVIFGGQVGTEEFNRALDQLLAETK